jgi:hypothetical protein
VLQVKLPAAFLVEYYTKIMHRRAGINRRVGQNEGQVLFCFVLALLKCTRIYFLGANNAPCLLAHSKHCSWMVCIVLQFSSVDLLKATVFTYQQNWSHTWRVVGLQASTRLDQHELGSNWCFL